jgi:AcrR family transcriptional regulator
LLNANENLTLGDLGSHIPRVGSFVGTYVDVRPRAAGAVIAHDRRERFGDQLADRGRFCRGPHLPPLHAYFDRDADLRPRSSHIGQVCCQLGLVASGRKLDTAQICRHAARVVSRSSPQKSPSRRDRRRQETINDIKAAARTQLAEGGPTGISLRAIARDLGMTPSAVHYYFPGREALLDALIVDGWDMLAMALRARYEQARPLPAHERWIAVTRAHRAWALEHPSEYLLLYGHTGLRVTPSGGRGVQKAMSKVVAVLFTMMRDALAAGEIDAERLQTATPAHFRQQLADWRETTEEMAGLPDGALIACLIGYTQLHGAITLELVGRIPPQLQPTALFDLQMAHVSGSLNAPPPPW